MSYRRGSILLADRGDVTFVVNVDQFAHENTLERDKTVPADVVPEFSRIIQDALSKARTEIIETVGEKLKTDSRFRKLLDKHDLVSKFGDRYTKVAGLDKNFFNFKDLEKTEWRKLFSEASEESGISFDLENDEAISQKSISVDTPENAWTTPKGIIVGDVVRFKCELHSAGGDWQESSYYFCCQESKGNYSDRFCLIPDKSSGNIHLVEEDGKFFPKDEDIPNRDYDKEEKFCWDNVPVLLRKHIDEKKKKMQKYASSDTDIEYKNVPMVGRFMIQEGDGSYGVLKVPEDFKRSVFNAIKTRGMQYDDAHGAHISVFTDEELEGMPKIIPEEGEIFPFFLRSVESVNPEGWDEMERVWFVTVESKELEALRKKYGFTPKMFGKHEFHITVAVKPK
jgi:hypothetical protein